MSDPEPPGATPEGVAVPEPPYPREDADTDERTAQTLQGTLTDQEVAELEARMREHGRPYEPPTSK